MPVMTKPDQHVEHRADGERAEDADRHVALGVVRLLRRGRDRVEADIGEEDDGGAAHDAAPAVLPGPRLGGMKAPSGLLAVTQFAVLTRPRAGHDEERRRSPP